MSKYAPLWKWVSEKDSGALTVTFDEIEGILTFPIDHSFLTYKKELAEFGWTVGKISMKNRNVTFQKTLLRTSGAMLGSRIKK